MISSKGFIINNKNELFSYEIEMIHCTLTKKKYNFVNLMNRLIEIYPKRENYNFLEDALEDCLFSEEKGRVEIIEEEMTWDIYYLSLKNNKIIFEQIYETERTIEINLDEFIIEENVIYLDH